MGESRIQKAERIANVIVSTIRSNGFFTDDDLVDAGFSYDEIRDLRPLSGGFASVALGESISNF